MARFADILTIVNGKNQKKVENPNGKYPIYGSGGIMGYADDYICEAETVVIGRKGSINNPIFVETPFWNVDTAFGLHADCSKLFPKYLYYFCVNYDFERLNTTVTIPSLTKANLLNIEIPLPPLEEQRRIAALLDKVSGLIAKRRAQLDKLDLMVKARFVEMFGDQYTNPKGWETGTIRDVVSEVKYGTSRPAVEGGAYKYLRMGNITFNGHLDLDDLKYIDIPASEIEKCIVKKGDVLFNRTNSKELVGKTCVFDIDEPMVIAGYIIRVRVNERVLPDYLSAVLNSQYGKRTLADMCKAIVGQANINAQELQSIAILIPPVEVQRQFSQFVNQVNNLASNMNCGLGKLETLKKALLQQYFE